MPIAFLVLAQIADRAAADLVATAWARTAADVRCVASDTTTVTVCGRRNADRFRASLATRVVDRRDDVVAERAALIHRNTPVQDLSPFLVGGGMAGVHVGTSFGAAGSQTYVRPIAP